MKMSRISIIKVMFASYRIMMFHLKETDKKKTVIEVAIKGQTRCWFTRLTALKESGKINYL